MTDLPKKPECMLCRLEPGSNSIQYYRVANQFDKIFNMVNKCCIFSILKKRTYIGYETRCFLCLNGDPDIIVSEMICFNELQLRLYHIHILNLDPINRDIDLQRPLT